MRTILRNILVITVLEPMDFTKVKMEVPHLSLVKIRMYMILELATKFAFHIETILIGSPLGMFAKVFKEFYFGSQRQHRHNYS